ncbi:hypothetical protein FF125_20770 [Aureibaculum algae]|uniref:Aromatic hydrocarbon degradation protein n=1 Tax=Aureibaculum algae TaxID=2584122 RepID=A0A5B7TVA1_9FLAO|nr:hypothetical protein [Aureibaculum algae]QCX40755.1 hypothetical protein FF125_20770 [Aureibaculum algae]
MIKKLIVLSLILLSFKGFTQKNNNSPYSFFGIGEETPQKTVEEMSMGEIGGAFNSSYQLTFTNPAALAYLQYTTYTIAGENKSISINDGTNKGSASTASLSYFALGIPIGNKGGVSFGLQPNTTVGYSLTEEFKDADGDLTEINFFEGSGGTNRVFLGFGYKLLKNVSIGLEASYVFGTIENSLLNRRNGVQLATMHTTNSELRGFTAKAGLQYSAKVSDKLILKTGAVFHLKNNLSNEGDELLFSLVNTNDGTVSPRDTLVNNSFDDDIKKPLNTILSVGLGQENKWYAGLEYSFHNAIDFTNGVLADNTRLSHDKMSRVSVGGYYIPKINSISSYWKRITYRAGFNMRQTGIAINNDKVNDLGMSFGVGLPIGKQLSNLNLGFEFGKRGEINNSLIKENYFNFRLGLTLNDRWFVKRKIQ